ncbi:MAG TPA: PilZ domain-containing protein [Nitrospira sp.]|nr:PilZ domain-containing protein [Nitrospira sp.]
MISFVEFMSICGVVSLTAAGVSQGLQRLRRSRKQHSNKAMNLPCEDSGRPAPGTWHEPRYGKRHAVNCRIEYVVDEIRHEGMLVDMARRGWRAQGMHPVANGTAMAVEIFRSDSVQRIVIEEVVVRWSEGVEFGVEVTRISPESAAALSDYLTLQYPAEEPQPLYGLSPFSYN